MNVTLYMAATLDGFIADSNGDEWVENWHLFKQTCADFGCVIMGTKAFKDGGVVIDGVQHIVLSSEHAETADLSNIHFVQTVEQALEQSHALGFESVLVVGGSETNDAFMASQQVDEVWVDVHPLTIGQGVKMFTVPTALQALSSLVHPEGFIHTELQVEG